MKEIYGNDNINYEKNYCIVYIGYYDVKNYTYELLMYVDDNNLKARIVCNICKIGSKDVISWKTIRYLNLEAKNKYISNETNKNLNCLGNLDEYAVFLEDYGNVELPSDISNIWTRIPYIRNIHQSYKKFFDKDTEEGTLSELLLCGLLNDNNIPIDELNYLLEQISIAENKKVV